MKYIIAGCILFLVGSTAHSTDVTNSSLETHLGFGYSDASGESMQKILRLKPEFEINFSARVRAVVEARIRLDFADELEPGRVNTDTYSTLSRPMTVSDLGTADIRDAYIERSFENGLLRVGKQQIVWGRLDGIKVLDVLNPQDFREFIMNDFSESRISLWSAFLDFSHGPWRTELALIPDNTGHAIAARGAWFELTAPRYRYGANPSDPSPPVITNRDSINASTSAYALRLSRQLGSTEIGAMMYSGIDYEPLGRVVASGDGSLIERYYERRKLFGLHAETSVGSIAIRAEFAMQPARIFNTRSDSLLSTVKLDQLSAGIGIDIDGPLGTFINIQHVHDAVRNAPAELVRPDTDQVSTLFVRRTFSYETISLSSRYYHSHELGDDMLTLAVTFLFGDATKLRLAADFFSGDPAGVFGQFDPRDRFVVSLTHTF